jgi:hypothetical protein
MPIRMDGNKRIKVDVLHPGLRLPRPCPGSLPLSPLGREPCLWIPTSLCTKFESTHIRSWEMRPAPQLCHERPRHVN